MGKPILLLLAKGKYCTAERDFVVVEGETVSRWGASFKKVQREGRGNSSPDKKVGAVGIALCENIAIEIDTIFR